MRPHPFPLHMPEPERRKVSQQRFNVLMGQIATLAATVGRDAAYVEPQQRALAVCIQMLVGLDLRGVGIPARVADAEGLAQNLLDIAAAVDPLIAAIGEEARENWSEVDMRCFDQPVLGALEGDAAHTIMAAAEADAEERRTCRPYDIAEHARRIRLEWSA